MSCKLLVYTADYMSIIEIKYYTDHKQLTLAHVHERSVQHLLVEELLTTSSIQVCVGGK